MASSTRGRNGILPVPVSATAKKPGSAQSQPKAQSKAGSPRLRLIVRRLPPGLIELEFWNALGDEWKIGKGKIDWAAYKDGKISKDPSKPSRPARAYLRVKEPSQLDLLSTRIKVATFQDAKNTSKDLCLLGPPSLEFAPYNKVPGSRVRHDGRQGTIDQDQEFIDFLQSLTEPVAKVTPSGVEGSNGKSEKVKMTPLIQFLKDKKANKAKEAALAKASKNKLDTKDGRSSKTESKVSVVLKKGGPGAAERARVEKATQDAVKAINRSVAAMQGKNSAQTSETKSTSAKEASAPPAKRERERGNISAAARMVQRDLGIVPRSPRATRAANAPATLASTDVSAVAKSSATRRTSVSSTSSANPPSAPQSSKTTTNASTSTKQTAQSQSSQRPQKTAHNPAQGAKSAFLKHANPSQGVTEELLRTTFAAFGTLTKCEIDKKKGFGYVDFTDAEGLKNAMQASPVKVGNGQVVVLENKSKGSSAKGAGPSPGPSQHSSKEKSVPTTAPARPGTSARAVTPVASVSSVATGPTAQKATLPMLTAPTAPRDGTSRGGNNNSRANSRGGAQQSSGSGRGNFGAANRGNQRGNFRGGRGGANRAGRGAAAAPAAGPASTAITSTTAPAPAAGTTGGKGT